MSSEELATLESFIINNNELHELELYLAKFNFFEATGITRQELKHSNFLRFLLDPAEISNTFIVKQVLKLICMRSHESGLSAIDVDFFSFSEAIVRREWQNIDLLIVSEQNKLVCTIENKVGASEHGNQLKKYEEIIDSEYKGYDRIFGLLTPDGDDASRPRWASISYTDIEGILTDFIEHYGDSIGNEISMAINHYLTLIKRYVVSDSEVARLCRKIYAKHQKAIDLIVEHKPDIQLFLKEVVERLIEVNYGLFKMEHSSKSCIRFSYREWLNNPIFLTGSGEWMKSQNILMFEVNNNDNGLFFSLIIGPGDPDIRKQIHEIALANKNIFKGVKSITDKYTHIFKTQVLTEKDLEKENEELEAKVIDKWDKWITEDVNKILELINLD